MQISSSVGRDEAKSRWVSARDRVEQWLSAIRPTGSTMLSDRLLTRTLMRGDERAEADLRTLVPMVGETWLPGPRLDISAFIVSWVLHELGETQRAAHLDGIIAERVDAWREEGASLPEPWRSSYVHWTNRAGFAHAADAGPPPPDPLASLYHDLHVIFFAADYGAHPVDLEAASPSLIAAASYASRPVMFYGPCRRNADLLAECILAELCLTPRRLDTLSEHLERWLPLQQPDGSFTPAPGAPLVAQHHASCVSALVLWMLDRP